MKFFEIDEDKIIYSVVQTTASFALNENQFLIDETINDLDILGKYYIDGSFIDARPQQ